MTTPVGRPIFLSQDDLDETDLITKVEGICFQPVSFDAAAMVQSVLDDNDYGYDEEDFFGLGETQTPPPSPPSDDAPQAPGTNWDP